MAVTRVATALAGTTLVVGLTGCGVGGEGDQKDEDTEFRPVQGLKAMESAGPVDVMAELRDGIRLNGHMSSVRFEVSETTDGVTRHQRGTIDWSSRLVGSTDFSFTGEPSDPTLSRREREELDGTKGAARYTLSGMYVDFGAGFAKRFLKPGKHWVRYAPDVLSGKAEFDVPSPTEQADDVRPVRFLEAIVETGEAEAVGTETVRGVRADRYTATLREDDEEPGDGWEQARKTFGSAADADQSEAADEPALTMDVWLDQQSGLLVKAKERVVADDVDHTATFHYDDYGVTVHPTEPPAARVEDADEVWPELRPEADG